MVLLILWQLGLMTGYTMGGVIHILLVIAILLVLIQVFKVEDDFGRFDPCRKK